MKTVFSNKELAHTWARQTQGTGKNSGGAFYFRDKTIYSFGAHFPIARFFTAPNGEDVVLFTTRTYSPTTARHVSLVWRALNYGVGHHIVRCKDIDFTSGSENIDDFKREIDRIMLNHDKARKPELYSGAVMEQARLARGYCRVMSLPVPVWALIPDDIAPGGALTALMAVHQVATNRGMRV